MFKKLLYFILFTISVNLLSMHQKPNELSWLPDGRPFAQPGSPEEKLLDRSIRLFRKLQLIKLGANVDACDLKGQTPLIIACNSDHYFYEVEMFLKAGSDPNLSDKFGWNPLHICCMYDQEKKAKLLIEYGANINQMSNNEFTPLMKASELNNKKIVKILIEAGANLEKKDNTGLTALKIAQLLKFTHIEQMLKNAGAQG